ncbi:MAG: agmatine deiminase family protein [Anaerolineales bacterium]|nr:agmatine deiminase family protein [Chloroflexota bacterium]MBL6980067.1 agmatine deiminase family protein [Anaerolineales bacterium]
MIAKHFNPAEFRMPAEWEPHDGTWLQWPQDKVYDGYELKLERIWLHMVDALNDHENVHIIVNGERQSDHIVDQLEYYKIGSKNVHFYVIPTNDVWARDNGPIFVINDAGQVAITDWAFNGWGDRFPYDLDDKVPAAIGEEVGIPVFKVPMVLEGGAVGVNGKGTFMATKSSIIDTFRNPGKSQADIEGVLSQYLGVTHFIWLTGAGRDECGLWGDETDSHIDIVARFSDESTVLYNWTDNENDPRYGMLRKSLQELKNATTESGKPMTLVPLPMPEVYQTSGMTDWRRSTLTDAAYSNYLIANDIVLVPVYGHAHDKRALAIIAEHFPGREVVAIEVVALIEHGGAIGCVTQPQPLAMVDE